MTIKTYKCSDDDKTLNKDLYSPQTISNVILKDNTSLLKPTFIFSWAGTDFSPIKGETPNYLYCVEWNRYYFIKDPIYSQQMVLLDCEVDVLMSNANQLLQKEMFVARQGQHITTISGEQTSTSLGNLLLPDDFLPVQADRKIGMFGDGSQKNPNFESISGRKDGSFVLMLNGGPASV